MLGKCEICKSYSSLRTYYNPLVVFVPDDYVKERICKKCYDLIKENENAGEEEKKRCCD